MAQIDTSGELRVSVAQLSTHTLVATVTGELDLYNADSLHGYLRPLADSGAAAVIVDLCGVSFVDSTALGVLASVAKRVRANGNELVIASDDPRLRRVLEITGLHAVMRVEASLASAVEAVGGNSLD